MVLLVFSAGCLGGTGSTGSPSQTSSSMEQTWSPNLSIVYPESPRVINMTPDEGVKFLSGINGNETAVIKGDLAIRYDGKRILGHYEFTITNLSKNSIYFITVHLPENPTEFNISIEGHMVNLSRLVERRVIWGRTGSQGSYISIYEVNFTPSAKTVHGVLNYSIGYPVFFSTGITYIESPLTLWKIIGKVEGTTLTYSLPEGYTLVVPGFGAFTGSGRIKDQLSADTLGISYIYDGKVYVKKFSAAGMEVAAYIPEGQYNEDSWKTLKSIVESSLEFYVNTTNVKPTSNVLIVISPYYYRSFYWSPNTVVLSGREGLGPILTKDPGAIPYELSNLWFYDYANFGVFTGALTTYMELAALERFGWMNAGYMIKKIETYVFRYGRSATIYQMVSEGLSSEGKEKEFVATVYIKGALVLRSLRFAIGEKAFYNGMHEALVKCHGMNCGLKDFEKALEEGSGEDLGWFFNEWFNSTLLPDYTLENLSVIKEGDSYRLTFTLHDRSNFTMPVLIRVVMENNDFTDKRVWVKNGIARITLTLDSKPTIIAIDPDNDILNVNRKFEVEGIEVDIS